MDENVSLENFASNSEDWPRISIITPSFNQGQFIEETIRSVVLQGYSNLEYIIIDGGSTDKTIDIIRKYESQLAYWISEPDQGQAHAINKGLRRCTGDVVGWINSDDLLLPGSLFTIARAYQNAPNKIIVGNVINFHTDSQKTALIRQKDITYKNMVVPGVSRVRWHQPGVYIPTHYIFPDLFLDESYRYLFDQDLLCYLLQHLQVKLSLAADCQVSSSWRIQDRQRKVSLAPRTRTISG